MTGRVETRLAETVVVDDVADVGGVWKEVRYEGVDDGFFNVIL